MFRSICERFHSLWSDSLYRNSFWLMAGTFSMTGIGFLYWLVAARFYTPIEVGLATTFLSATTLINNFAMLGFGTALIHYLPGTKDKAKQINTAFTTISIASILIGAIYLVGIPIWTEKISFVLSSMPLILLLIFFFPINALNGITDTIFTAYRQTQWVFASNIIQSVVKLLAVFLLASYGSWGVIGSNMAGIFVAVIFCLIAISTLYKIKLSPRIDFPVLLEVKTYALGSYFSALIGVVPSLIMPIIITNRISPEQTAYFYMPNMIVGLLAIVPTTISRSFFTESSYRQEAVPMRPPILMSYALLLPMTAVLVVFGKNILNLFGKNYAVGGYNFLLLISCSVLVSVVGYFLSMKLLIAHKLRAILTVNLLSSFSYLLLAWLLASSGIEGVAIASIASQLISLAMLYLYNKKYRSVFETRTSKKVENIQLSI